MTTSTKPYSRTHISSHANELEVAYSNRRGWQEIDRSGSDGHFRIQRVSNFGGRPFWDTVETSTNEDSAIERMASLVQVNRRTYRVAKVVAQ